MRLLTTASRSGFDSNLKCEDAHLHHRWYVLSCLVVNMMSCVDPLPSSSRTAPITKSLSANPRSKTCIDFNIWSTPPCMHAVRYDTHLPCQLGTEHFHLLALPGVCHVMLEALLPGTQRQTSAPPQSPMLRWNLALPAGQIYAAPCLHPSTCSLSYMQTEQK